MQNKRDDIIDLQKMIKGVINMILDGKGNLFEDRRKNDKKVKKDRRNNGETVKTETKRKCCKAKNK